MKLFLFCFVELNGMYSYLVSTEIDSQQIRQIGAYYILDNSYNWWI